MGCRRTICEDFGFELVEIVLGYGVIVFGGVRD